MRQAPVVQGIVGIPRGDENALQWAPVGGVDVQLGAVEPGGDVLWEGCAARDDDEAGVLRHDLADGVSVLVLTGQGPWYESATLYLELCTECDAPTVRAVSMAWGGDIPPFMQWLSAVTGPITLDVNVSPLRIAFDLESEGAGFIGVYQMVGAVNVPSAPSDGATAALSRYLTARALALEEDDGR